MCSQMPSENSSTVFRCDAGVSPVFELSPEGYLIAWAKIARAGVQLYQNPDGSIRREYRPPEEVSSPESLKSFAQVPICLEHPPFMLSSLNAQSSTVGWTGERVVYDGGFVETSAKIIDANAIKAVLDRKKGELSAGYSCRIEPVSGITPDGEPYDFVQREIKGNHVAITAKARGGSELTFVDKADNWELPMNLFSSERLDSLYVEVNTGEEDEDEEDEMELEGKSKEELMGLVKSLQDSLKEKEKSLKSYMDSAAYLQGVVDAQKLSDGEEGEKANSRLKAEQAKVKDLQGRLDSEQEKSQSLEAEVKKLEERNRRLDSDLAEEVQSRHTEIKKAKQSWLQTYEACKDFLPKMDSSVVDLSPVDMMRLAIENSCPNVNVESDDPVYIKGMFDLMVKGDIRVDSATGAFNRNLVATKESDAISVANQELKAEKRKKIANAWQVKN